MTKLFTIAVFIAIIAYTVIMTVDATSIVTSPLARIQTAPTTTTNEPVVTIAQTDVFETLASVKEPHSALPCTSSINCPGNENVCYSGYCQCLYGRYGSSCQYEASWTDAPTLVSAPSSIRSGDQITFALNFHASDSALIDVKWNIFSGSSSVIPQTVGLIGLPISAPWLVTLNVPWDTLATTTGRFEFTYLNQGTPTTVVSQTFTVQTWGWVISAWGICKPVECGDSTLDREIECRHYVYGATPVLELDESRCYAGPYGAKPRTTIPCSAAPSCDDW